MVKVVRNFLQRYFFGKLLFILEIGSSLLWYILGINIHFPNSLLGDKWIFIVMYENMSENTDITDSDITREHRQLLDWCIQRGCIWEWNR